MKQNNYCVYKHTSPNGKVYIGITCKKPQYRWNKGKGYINNSYFYNAIQKYGWDNFTHEILESELPFEKACFLEKQYIEKYKSSNREFGYNSSIGGECSGKGVIPSEQTRKKLSEALKGEKSPFCKKVICIDTQKVYNSITEASKETGSRISLISAVCQGRQKTTKGQQWAYFENGKEYKKEKIEKKTGRKGKKVMCIETGIIYNTMKQAEIDTGIYLYNISSVCRGRNKTAGGKHWKIIN